jgi:homoserine O-acetyltransferase
MGGMQALEWAIRYPELVRSAIVLASTATISAQGIAFHAIGRNAITSDPGWLQGEYYGNEGPRQGLAIARMVGHLTYLSDESLGSRFGRRLQDKEGFEYDFSHEFEIESYLDYKGTQFAETFDANSYLYITKAMDYYDLTSRPGGLVGALADTHAKFLLASFTSDWLYPSRQAKAIVSALMQLDRDVSYVEIESPHGHDSFLIETERQTQIIRSFLANVS